MKNKIMDVQSALAPLKDGDKVMVAGFGIGYPFMLMDGLLETGKKHLTLYVNSMGHKAFIEMTDRGMVDRAIASFYKGNKRAIEMRMENPEAIEIAPQGTFSERVRAGGSGIPAFYTPVGYNTFVGEGKEVKEFNGVPCIMETALRANVGIIHAAKVDESGNCAMRGGAISLHALVPAACDYCIVEADEIVPVGAIDPNDVIVPHIYIDAIVKLEGYEDVAGL